MARLLIPPLLFLLILLGLLSLDQRQRDADLVLASDNEIFTLDPQRMSWLGDMRMGYALFEGLVRWNPKDFSLQPAAAAAWSVSDDGRVWTFQIDENARWSNGAPVTAHDFVWSWQRLLLPDTAANYSNLLFAVEGAKAFWDWRSAALAHFTPGPDAAERLMSQTEARFRDTVGIRAVNDQTLELRLTHPVPYLLDLLAFAPLMPVYRPAVEGWPAAAESWHETTPPPWSEREFVTLVPETGRIQPDHRWARPGSLVSNGPYLLDQWRYRRDLRLVPNPSAHSPGHIDTVLVRSFPDPNTALLAFRSGEVDWLTGVSADVRRDLLETKTAEPQNDDILVRSIHAVPAFGTEFFSFNCSDTLANGTRNPFGDARVRRAFAQATDKQTIVDHVTGLHEPISGSFTPKGSITGYQPPNGLEYNPERAVQLLADAGWHRRDDGLLVDSSGDPFPSVELKYTTSSPRNRRIATALRGQWQAQLGVDVSLSGQDSKSLDADLSSGDFMVARGRWYGDWGDPTTFLELFRSTSGNNDRRFKDADIDAQLNDAAAETDPATRMAMLAKIERELFEVHMPLLPICQLVEVTMHDPDVLGGMTSHPRLIQYIGDIYKRSGAAP
ncbi:MAG: peptide ABC transporter substrate-binding protein [Phycisphaerales bacterium]|jgi:oligopeptide transport system substrate-binding protein|nr:peptide ABC transporter substrate-binding protein [Phycisphaerales bacterium]